jgi:uncharacterized protein
MSDLREQLLKAGLVSAKQVRKAKHEERVHRKEVGHEGLESERAERDQALRQEQEEKRRQDQEREAARKIELAEQEAANALARRIQTGWMRDATGGNRRYYFLAEGGRITYLDLNDQAARRVQSGTAAIVLTLGAVRGEFCLVDGNTAASLAKDNPQIICHWNRGNSR